MLRQKVQNKEQVVKHCKKIKKNNCTKKKFQSDNTDFIKINKKKLLRKDRYKFTFSDSTKKMLKVYKSKSEQTKN